MRMTVNEYMQEELFGIGFRGDEYVRAASYTIREMNHEIIAKARLKRKDGTEVPVKDCWETDADDYTQEHLDWLFARMLPYLLQWCLNVIHSQR